MFNKQLTTNIAEIDAQIGALSKEIEEQKKDVKYEVKMEKLQALAELRCKLGKVEGENMVDTVVELDKQIEELTKVVSHLESDGSYSEKLKKLEDLTKIRTQLAESRAKESIVNQILPHAITGALGICTVMMVLKYEKTDVITGQAFGLATKLFRGR